jgi:hypothetical protein
VVSQPQVYIERSHDTEFASQWQEAIAHFADLLEARTTQLTLEGNIEPVYYMGVVVGYIRKFDSKLQIEMLRAYKPERYKTPGVNVNVGVKGDVFVLTEEQRHILMDYKRSELLAWQPPTAEPVVTAVPEDAPGSKSNLRTPTTYDENGHESPS